jgi:hypothetical protein
MGYYLSLSGSVGLAYHCQSILYIFLCDSLFLHRGHLSTRPTGGSVQHKVKALDHAFLPYRAGKNRKGQLKGKTKKKIKCAFQTLKGKAKILFLL